MPFSIFVTLSSSYESCGGDDKFYRQGQYVSGAAQGYLIVKKTAEKYGITNIGQLKDPKIAKLFDADGDGKADLTGCNPGWGCELVIENQLSAYKLNDNVRIIKVITRQSLPILSLVIKTVNPFFITRGHLTG